MRRVVLFCALAACARGESKPAAPTPIAVAPASAPPIVSAAPEASAPAVATFTTNADQACSESERVGPASREDFAWAKRVASLFEKNVARKKLVCIFGTATGKNGDFVTIAPRHASFTAAQALGRYSDYYFESIEVTYAPAERPLLTSAEKVLGPAKSGPRVHFDSPRTSIMYVILADERSVRAIATLDDTDPKRIAKLLLDVEDLRGWSPPELRCWDGAHISVFAASDRLPAGRWVIDANDVATGTRVAQFTCVVPEDSLDRATCTPPGDKPPGATVDSMSSGFDLRVPGLTTHLAFVFTRDGAQVARHEVRPRYSSVGTCTSALDWVKLEK
jgi:hypothetical protein